MSLDRLMFPQLPDPSDKPAVCNALENTIPLVKVECQELQAMLKDYMMIDHPNNVLMCEVEDALDKAFNWCTKIRRIYQDEGFYRKSLGSKLHEDLPRFSHGSSMNILEFIGRFESLSADYEIPAEKAELFFQRFLSESLQEEMEAIREDYNKMKSTLIHKYGNIEILADQILASIVVLEKPSQESTLKSKVINKISREQHINP